MRILLDTHCFLWLQASPDRLTARTREVLASPRNALFLSAASAWEIAIKYALGKLPLPSPPGRYVPTRMRWSGTQSLAVEPRHALRVAALPPHHRDPFDRLIIAQAQLERMIVLTVDPHFEAYDVRLLPP